MIKLYYNSKNSIGKQALAYVNSSKKDILAIDLSKTKLTGTQWIEIAENLGVLLSELVNQEHPNFRENYGGEQVNLNEDDWIKILTNSPETLKGCILMIDNAFYTINTPSAIASYLEPDTAGLDPQKPDVN
ncbi:arsenate reductase family protein [Lacinutrix salivirga]